MTDMTAQFAEIVGTHNLLTGDAISEDYAHDEVLDEAAAETGVPGQARRPPKRSRSCSRSPRKTRCR